MNRLKKLDKESAAKVVSEMSIDELSADLKELNFQRMSLALQAIKEADPQIAEHLLQQIDAATLSEKIEGSNYSTVLIFTAGLLGIDDVHLEDLLREIPKQLIIREEELNNIYHFNKLLYIFFRLEMPDKASYVIEKSRFHQSNFMRTSDIRTLVSYLRLVSNYDNIFHILKRNERSIFNKIRNYQPKNNRDKQLNPIPGLVKVVSVNYRDMGERLLRHINHMVNHRKVRWGADVNPKEILGFCYYQMGVACTEWKRPNYGKSDHFIGTAVRIFQKMDQKPGLCLCYLQQAKNALAVDNIVESKFFAAKAGLYAQEAELPSRAGEINSLIKELETK